MRFKAKANRPSLPFIGKHVKQDSSIGNAGCGNFHPGIEKARPAFSPSIVVVALVVSIEMFSIINNRFGKVGT